MCKIRKQIISKKTKQTNIYQAIRTQRSANSKPENYHWTKQNKTKQTSIGNFSFLFGIGSEIVKAYVKVPKQEKTNAKFQVLLLDGNIYI